MTKYSNPWVHIKKGITDWVEQGISELYPNRRPEIKPRLEKPPEGMGDLALPLFEIAAVLKTDPGSIAHSLIDRGKKPSGVSKIERVGGYLNFCLDPAYLTEITLKGIMALREAYGTSTEKRGERIILEHTSANPNGPLHVGRARNPIIGDTIARVLRANGYDVTTEYYTNDSGMQVATMVWGNLNLHLNQDETIREKADHRYVRYYQEASKLTPSIDEVRALLKKYEAADPETITAFKIHEEVLGGIVQSLKRINIEHDAFVRESVYLWNGDVADAIERLKSLCKVEGKCLYLEIAGDNIYLTRSDGTTLYISRDLAYHLDKFRRCDTAVNILGEDHKLESRQLGQMLDLLGERRPLAVFYSFISLPEGKMSTRRGNIVHLDDLLDEAVSRAKEEIRKRRPDMDAGGIEKISQAIGPSAVRYNIIKVQPQKPIEFRWEEALSFDGDSAPFAQYSHARCCSILKKLGDVEGFTPELLGSASEIGLVKSLASFPSLVEEICDLERPRVHLLAGFLYDLAKEFNQFYRDCPVIRADEPLRGSRATLVLCTKRVLENCAHLLGLEMPGEM